MSEQKLTVLIAEDDQILHLGIKHYLTTNNEHIEVVGIAKDGAEAVQKTRQLRPHVVVMDLEMPILDGIQATRQIKQEMPETRVVMLTVFTNPEQVWQALDAGADGYCHKNIEIEQLQIAIAAASQGSIYLDAKIARCAVNSHTPTPANPEDTAQRVGLDNKDLTILQRIAEGKSTTAIGKELNISPNTIKWIINRIFEKLEVHCRVQAALKAYQLGLVKMEW